MLPRYGIQDATTVNNLLENDKNYQPVSDVAVFEAVDKLGSWFKNVSDIDLQKCVQTYAGHSAKSSRLLAILITIRRTKAGATYGHQASISQSVVTNLLKNNLVHPAFLNNLLGRSDYWSPGIFQQFDAEKNPSAIQFFCQHQRWNVNVVASPCSVFMNYDCIQNKTLYLIVSGEADTIAQSIASDFSAILQQADEDFTVQKLLQHPCILHVNVAFLSFEQSKAPIAEVRTHLYTQLDQVEQYSESRVSRYQLGATTRELHTVSQNADSLIASADQGIGVAKKLLLCYQIVSSTLVKRSNPPAAPYNSLEYILSSLECQRRWLLSYKSRKDTAMNLVFNLVTQQDSLTTVDISYSMKKDSSSMNTIALLTMIFLPATAIATIIGSGMFTNGVNIPLLGIYIGITLPVTIGVIGLWRYLPQLQRSRQRFATRVKDLRRERKSVDVEANNIENSSDILLESIQQAKEYRALRDRTTV